MVDPPSHSLFSLVARTKEVYDLRFSALLMDVRQHLSYTYFLFASLSSNNHLVPLKQANDRL